jgi:hypothetical protein
MAGAGAAAEKLKPNPVGAGVATEKATPPAELGAESEELITRRDAAADLVFRTLLVGAGAPVAEETVTPESADGAGGRPKPNAGAEDVGGAAAPNVPPNEKLAVPFADSLP